MENPEKIHWNEEAKEKFKFLVGKMPVFLQSMAEQRVSERALDLAQKAHHSEITEKDMVDAFFTETPFGFQGLMKNDLTEAGINYTQYGYTK